MAGNKGRILSNLSSNLIPERYRQVALADPPVSLEEVPGYLRGREAYRRTRYIVAQHEGSVGVVEVSKVSEQPLFSPIVDARLLASPAETAFVEDADVDVGVPSQLAAAALRLAPGIRCVVVKGRYEHVNFILDPRPLKVRVVEIVPPEPAKLLDQARRVLEVADDLPPIELVPQLFDIGDLARHTPSSRYVFPCRSSGIDVGGADVTFLDQRPPHADWVLVGPERSLEIHHWFYGEGPRSVVDVCPHNLRGSMTGPTLTKCSLLEEVIERDGEAVVVPWGASLRHVHDGLAMLAGLRAVADSSTAVPISSLDR